MLQFCECDKMKGMRLKQMKAFSFAATSGLRRLCWSAVCVLPAVMAAVICMPVSSTAAANAVSGRARHGEEIFKQRCIACHNKQPGDTSPFGPPNLNGIFRGPSPITTKQATTIIVNGKGTMPGWGSVLSKADISDVIAYLRTK